MRVEVKVIHPSAVIESRPSTEMTGASVDSEEGRVIQIKPDHTWDYYNKLLEARLMDGDECKEFVVVSINGKGKFSIARLNPKTGAPDL